jgi:hypothetical protein
MDYGLILQDIGPLGQFAASFPALMDNGQGKSTKKQTPEPV